MHAFLYFKHNKSELLLNYLLFILVVETKEGTISVASAFAGHQEG
jgi:hypothetical protein